MFNRFVPNGKVDLAADVPLLPAQSAVAFVLTPEAWPMFRAWLNAEHGEAAPDAADRADMERAFSALIKITREQR